MKKLILGFLIGLGLISGIAYASSVFTSQQLAPNPQANNCLMTNGANPGVNSWASCGAGSGSTTVVSSASSPYLTVTQSGSNATITAASVLSLQNNASAGGINFSTATGTNIQGTLSSLNISQFTNNSGYLTSAIQASSTLIAGGTATFSPSVTFASSSPDTTWNIICGTATCTFDHPNNLLTTTVAATTYPTFTYASSTYLFIPTAGANVTLTSTSTINSNTFTYTVGTSGSDFNGSTDSAIQSALTAASTTGGTILVKKGTYTFASNVNIYNNETLMCDAGATFNVTTTTSQSIYFNGVTNAALSNCVVHDVTPNALSFGITSYREVEVHNSHNIKIEGNTFTNSSGYDIYNTSDANNSTTDVTILNNYIQNNGHQDAIGGGPFVQGNSTTSDISVVGNHIYNVVGNGTIGANVDPNCFDMVAMIGLTFTGNECHGMINLSTEKVPDQNIVISGNTLFPNNGSTSTSDDIAIIQKAGGIATATPGQIIVSNNTLAGGTILMEGSPTSSIDSVIISNNTIRNATSTAQGADAIPASDGVYLDYVKNANLSNNNIVGNASTALAGIGIKLTANTANILSTNNIIKDYTTGFDMGSVASNQSNLDTFINDTTKTTNNGSLFNFSGGFLGIGTVSPAYPLHVLGTNSGALLQGMKCQNSATAANTSCSLDFNDSTSDLGTNPTAQVQGIRTGSPGGELAFSTLNGSGSTGIRVYIDALGNLNIATLTITSLLSTDANKNLQSVALTTTGSSGPATFSGNTLNIPQYTGGAGGSGVPSTTPFTNPYVPYATTTGSLTNSPIAISGNNVGIGTPAPNYPLQVVATSSGANDMELRLWNSATAVNTAESIDFNNSTSDLGTNPTASIRGSRTGSPGGSLGLYTLNPSGNSTLGLLVDTYGNVNIATLTVSSLVGTDANHNLNSIALPLSVANGGVPTNGTIYQFLGNSATNSPAWKTATTTGNFYLDPLGSNANQNGNYLTPFHSLSAAIASSTGAAGYVYNLSPNTYVDGAPDTFPTNPFFLNGNEATYVPASGVTLPGSFDIYDLTIAGNVTESDNSLNFIHQFNNGVISGNLSLAGNATLEGMAMPSTTSALTILGGALTNANASFIQSQIQDYGTFNLNDDEVIASTTNGAAIVASTTGSTLNILGATIIQTSNQGGINASNGATSTPNNLMGITLVSASTTATSGIHLGNALTFLCDVNVYSSINGSTLYPDGTNYKPCIDGSLTVQATTTLLGIKGSFLATDPNGVIIATTTPSGSGSYTPTAGQNIYLTATSSSAGTFNAIPFSTFTVNANAPTSTTNFPYIQTALNACGTNGGGNIYLTDPSYNIGSTGLTFKGNDCNVYGTSASTTINFTGATTVFKTNSAAGQYSHDGIHNLTILGDGNANGVVLDASDMAHNTYDHIIADDVGYGVKIADTQNITFYNEFSDWDVTTLKSYGIYASSTNSVNENIFTNFFTGCNANCTGVYMNNANNNKFYGFRAEPSTLTGTVGVRLTDQSYTNGVFDNQFYGSYIEANKVGISISGTNGSTGGIIRNQFIGGIIDSDTTDISASSTTGYLQTFVGLDNNFGTQLTSLQGPVGVDNLSATALMDIQDPTHTNLALSVKDNTNFAENAVNLVQFQLFNGSDSANVLNLINAGTGYTLVATSTSNSFYLTSTGRLSVGSSTPNSAMVVEGYAGETIPLFTVASSTGSPLLTVSGAVAAPTDYLLTVASSTNQSFNLFTVSGLGDVTLNHLIGSSTLPTIATSTGDGSAAGTATIMAGSTDLAGSVTAVTANAPAANATIWTLTFNRTYTSAPFCTIDSNTSTPAFIEDIWTTTTPTTLVLKSSTTALTGTSTYESTYHCVGQLGG